MRHHRHVVARDNDRANRSCFRSTRKQIASRCDLLWGRGLKHSRKSLGLRVPSRWYKRKISESRTQENGRSIALCLVKLDCDNFRHRTRVNSRYTCISSMISINASFLRDGVPAILFFSLYRYRSWYIRVYFEQSIRNESFIENIKGLFYWRMRNVLITRIGKKLYYFLRRYIKCGWNANAREEEEKYEIHV